MNLMYSIRDIFDQAINNEKSITTKMPNGCNVVYKGVKIQMFPDRIEILDMSRGGDYYKVVSQDIYSLFYKYTSMQYHVKKKYNLKPLF